LVNQLITTTDRLTFDTNELFTRWALAFVLKIVVDLIRRTGDALRVKYVMIGHLSAVHAYSVAISDVSLIANTRLA